MKPAPKQLNITIYLKKLLKGCIQNLTGTVDTLDALSKDVLLKRGSSRDPWTKKTWDTSVQRVNYKHPFFYPDELKTIGQTQLIIMKKS